MQTKNINFGAKLGLAVAFVTGLVCCANPRSSFASTADDFSRGMKAFQSRDYKTSDSVFSRVSQSGSEQAPSAMYMDALSLQYLGNGSKATLMYKTVCDRYPDSAACVRAQAALARLDPQYLKKWKTSHPDAGMVGGSSGGAVGIIPDVSAQVAPTFTFGTRNVTATEGTTLLNQLESGQALMASVSQIPINVQYIRNSPGSFIGLNQLNNSGIKHHARVNGLYTGDVIINRVRVSNFPFRVKASVNGPVQLGKDFEETFKYTLAMSDPDYAHRYQTALAMHKKAEFVTNKASSDTSADGKGGGPSGSAATETFEISYRTDKGQNKYVKVYIDNSPIDMLFGASGVTTVPPSLLRSTAAEYVPDATELNRETTDPNSTIRLSGVVNVGSIRLGRIDKRNWPVRIEATSGIKYQAPIDSTAYPRLGSDVYAEWSVEPDEAHYTLKFTRKAN